jgi:hypothetical protein
MSPPLSAGTSWRDRVGSGAAARWTRRFLEENRRFLEENKSARAFPGPSIDQNRGRTTTAGLHFDLWPGFAVPSA